MFMWEMSLPLHKVYCRSCKARSSSKQCLKTGNTSWNATILCWRKWWWTSGFEVFPAFSGTTMSTPCFPSVRCPRWCLACYCWEPWIITSLNLSQPLWFSIVSGAQGAFGLSMWFLWLGAPKLSVALLLFGLSTCHRVYLMFRWNDVFTLQFCCDPGSYLFMQVVIQLTNSGPITNISTHAHRLTTQSLQQGEFFDPVCDMDPLQVPSGVDVPRALGWDVCTAIPQVLAVIYI